MIFKLFLLGMALGLIILPFFIKKHKKEWDEHIQNVRRKKGLD